jgi:hypothetical protein
VAGDCECRMIEPEQDFPPRRAYAIRRAA